MQENPLWQYSLRVYTRPPVAATLLALQESCDADVNVLLSCCWCGMAGRLLSDSEVASLVAASHAWREAVTLPLRRARQFARHEDVDATVYESLKIAEIAAERHQQDRLFAILGDLKPAELPPVTQRERVAANLAVYTATLDDCGEAQWRALLDLLFTEG